VPSSAFGSAARGGPRRARRLRLLWDAGLAGGSFVASFIQGTAVGALVEGLAIKDIRYVRGAFDWLSPFALLCGLGLCFGYALLGAGWLTYKTAADVQTLAFRLLPRLTAAFDRRQPDRLHQRTAPGGRTIFSRRLTSRIAMDLKER
jgi:hypothetical protein